MDNPRPAFTFSAVPFAGALTVSLSRFVTCAFVLGTAVLSPVAADSQQKPSDTLLTVDHYLNYETVGDPQISPDGSQIIYTRRWVNKLEDKWETALWVMDADGGRNRFLMKGGGARWSPDGTRIAFLAEGEPKGSQIFVRWMGTDETPTQITRLSESPGDIAWSPDGKSIGFTMFVEKKPQWSIDMPSAPESAKWTPAPRIVDDLHFRQDRRGFTESGARHLFIVSADGGTERQVTSGEWSVGARFDGLDQGASWDFTPDGKTLLVDGIPDSTQDKNYRNSNIYAVDAATGAIRRLTMDEGAWTNPVVSPDGKRVAYSGYPATTASYRAADLYVMNVDGSGARKISGNLDRDPGNVMWLPDGSGVYFTIGDRGTSNLYLATVNGDVRQVTDGEHMLGVSSMSRNGQLAVAVRSSYHEPPDVVRVDLRRNAAVTPLTEVNADLLDRIKLGEVERIRYASTGGAEVDGWIVKPPGFDPSRKYPLIMEIHGGPHGMYNVAFNWMFQNFASAGYVVLYTNPRGSTGYGSEFGNAIERAYPSVDYDDLMAGVDTVVGRGYIDTRSMYVGGCSGGGVLSSWVIGHTQRFAAAAVRCPVTNWLSFAGQTDVPLFTFNFFEKPFWEDPQKWLEQSSLMHVGKVTTPTLLMTGELDLRTPIAQSDEYYVALKMRGIPTTMLRFNGEYHGTGSKPSNFMRTQLYMMSWYQKYAGKGGETTTEN
jgi:dipeptidyl aminopeptidase/acylaminoacyl peptidase